MDEYILGVGTFKIFTVQLQYNIDISLSVDKIDIKQVDMKPADQPEQAGCSE